MAKRELSSTLRNLKFMQRAAQKEEKPKKEDEVKPDGNFFNAAQVRKKCVVIMEGDPHPGAFKGRMSFQSFNPTIDKLNQEAANCCQSEPATPSANTTARARENGSSQGGSQSLAVESNDIDGDLKRKQPEVVSEAQYPNKSQKNIQGDRQSPPSRDTHKQQKREKLDWNVLRPPPKYQNQRD